MDLCLKVFKSSLFYKEIIGYRFLVYFLFDEEYYAESRRLILDMPPSIASSFEKFLQSLGFSATQGKTVFGDMRDGVFSTLDDRGVVAIDTKEKLEKVKNLLSKRYDEYTDVAGKFRSIVLKMPNIMRDCGVPNWSSYLDSTEALKITYHLPDDYHRWMGVVLYTGSQKKLADMVYERVDKIEDTVRELLPETLGVRKLIVKEEGRYALSKIIFIFGLKTPMAEL